jgi:hypothetical protein
VNVNNDDATVAKMMIINFEMPTLAEISSTDSSHQQIYLNTLYTNLGCGEKHHGILLQHGSSCS